MKYVALLRGVNVGKAVRVPMGELKSVLEGLGMRDVTTYLNSGNAIFCSEMTAAELQPLVDTAFTDAFGQPIPTLIKSAPEMAAIAESVPSEWANSPTQQTYVAYLFPDVDRPELVSELPVKTEYMTIFHTPGAIVWNIQRENYNRSHITKIVQHSAYARMTTRNVNTARKLAELSAEH
ncbi:MAG TPA: DUF1697 domain-containing protein [Coriobacteriia bacterium]|nr:DUF1697 domain-containing protein [Coriobacteriia bacterium]